MNPFDTDADGDYYECPPCSRGKCHQCRTPDCGCCGGVPAEIERLGF